MSTVTCRTPGCKNDGVAIQMELDYTDPETEETRTVDAVQCGACGQPITDIT